MIDAYGWRESVSMGLDPVADRRAKLPEEGAGSQGSGASKAAKSGESAADKYRVGGQDA